MKKFLAPLVAVAALSTSMTASALEFNVDYRKIAVGGIQKVGVFLRNATDTVIELRLRDGTPIQSLGHFKSYSHKNLSGIPLKSNQEEKFTMYFKVPKNGEFKYKLCAITNGEALGSEDSKMEVRVQICRNLEVRN